MSYFELGTSKISFTLEYVGLPPSAIRFVYFLAIRLKQCTTLITVPVIIILYCKCYYFYELVLDKHKTINYELGWRSEY